MVNPKKQVNLDPSCEYPRYGKSGFFLHVVPIKVYRSSQLEQVCASLH